MTRKFWTLFAATGAIAVSLLSQEPAQSQGQPGFYCGVSRGAPATLYQNREGRTEPWIYWTSDAFSDAGYTPEQRCQEVSARLETYRRNRQLQLITVGRMNGENVVCTASQVNGRCVNLIYTLKPGQDAVRTLNNFLAWREGQAGTPSLFESNQQAPYIDVRERLGEDGGATAPAAPNPTVTQPVTPQPSGNPGGGGGDLREL